MDGQGCDSALFQVCKFLFFNAGSGVNFILSTAAGLLASSDHFCETNIFSRPFVSGMWMYNNVTVEEPLYYSTLNCKFPM